MKDSAKTECLSESLLQVVSEFHTEVRLQANFRREMQS